MLRRQHLSGLTLGIAVLTLLVAFVPGAFAQNHEPNPYRTVEGWAKMPPGRAWGSTSAVYPAPDGKHIWVADAIRCCEKTPNAIGCRFRPIGPTEADVKLDARGLLTADSWVQGSDASVPACVAHPQDLTKTGGPEGK